MINKITIEDLCFCDLVKRRDGLTYKRDAKTPFSGRVVDPVPDGGHGMTARCIGHFKDGKRHGRWDWFYDNGRHKGGVRYRDGGLVYAKNEIPATRLEKRMNGLTYRKASDNVFERAIQQSESPVSFSEPYTGIAITEGSKRKFWRRESHKDGVKHGEWLTFAEQPPRKPKNSRTYPRPEHAKKCYANGRLHGCWESFFHDGQLRERKNYKNGVGHGPYEMYWPDGKIKHKGSYENGRLHGRWDSFFNDGQVHKRKRPR